MKDAPPKSLSRPFAAVALLGLAGCQAFPPETFVAEPAGWKTIELRDDLTRKYEAAWQAAVDTVAMEWDIEVVDKDSGYLRTAWKYTIIQKPGTPPANYGNRVSLKFPASEIRDKVMVKTEAIWNAGGVTRNGFDTDFNRDCLAVLQGRLGRTVK